MAVRDTSLRAFEKHKPKMGPGEVAVFEVLQQLGPMHDRRLLQAMQQREAARMIPKEKRRSWEINTICARRNRLLGLGVIVDLGAHHGIWNGRKKTYRIWRIRGDGRLPVGWTKVELPQPKERPLPRMFGPSEAGKVLGSCRKKKKERQTLLFT